MAVVADGHLNARPRRRVWRALEVKRPALPVVGCKKPLRAAVGGGELPVELLQLAARQRLQRACACHVRRKGGPVKRRLREILAMLLEEAAATLPCMVRVSGVLRAADAEPSSSTAASATSNQTGHLAQLIVAESRTMC